MDRATTNSSTPASGSRSPDFDIFICYRRAASAKDAAHLYDNLFRAFGETVFIDDECLPAGQHWRDRIGEVIAGSAVMVVLLSAGWLEEIEERHRNHRVDEVIRELEMALDAGKTLIPVFVDGAATATSTDAQRLPADTTAYRVVRALADTHAVRWRAASRGADLERLRAELTNYLPRFGERLIRRCQQHLAACLSFNTASEPWRTKFKGLTDAVQRPELEPKLVQALEADKVLCVLHAEEGVGKTIALGSLLQRCGDRPVLLTDASDPAWRLGFEAGVAALLKAGAPRSGVSDSGRIQRLVSDTELELALAQPLLIAIDGLNEPEPADQINWRILLQEATRLIARERPWRLLVTVRSHAWKHRISSSSVSAACQELCIPLWSNKECRVLANRLGFAWAQLDPEVSKQLRRPRMLIAVARIPPEKLQGWELSYALVLLLDLQQRGSAEHACLSFADYCGLLQDLGRQTLAGLPLTRDVLTAQCTALDDAELTRELELLCDQGLVIRDHTKLRIDEPTASVAIGLRLLQILRDTGKSDLDALREVIARTLADGQDDTTSKALGHAIAAGLHPRMDGFDRTGEDGDPVLAALFLEWRRGYNQDPSPRRQLRWLLPELGSLAQTGALRDPEDWLAQALRSGPSDSIRLAFLRRLDHWFAGLDLAAESFTEPSNPVRVAKRRLRFQQGRTCVAVLRDAGPKEARLQRLGLDVAMRCALDPRVIDLNALVVAVAVQPAHGWEPLIKWVCSRQEDWWPLLEPIWRGVADAVDIDELRENIARLLYAVWPTPACTACISPHHLHPAWVEHTQPVDYRLMVDVQELPDPDGVDRLHRKVKVYGLEIRQPELAALALWSTPRLQLHITSLVDQATDLEQPLRFFGTRLASLAPLLTPDQARRLRARVVRGASLDKEERQLCSLSLTSVWLLPQARRTAAVLRQLRLLDLSKDVLLAAPLTPEAAAQLVQRIARDPVSPLAGRLVFWLFLAQSDANESALGAALANVLPILSSVTLPCSTQYWLLCLVWRFRLM